ncbi:MAG TPA: glycoside hydrolase family 38 C-terminal domain-containing protein [Planctomycetota bacterium]|nr:glycoside hydrolase family 38 C-terminal domain-containing protein [Planctomycetota bacterium]HRR79204.1 glycoside hydrolase family 38 C-terminal domain-containing protein [Planctomycetota bacterium]HRT94229.1 glycoside hydrolase family 38 C-terminal domain-containing protein [Planctomycetota bacterium]
MALTTEWRSRIEQWRNTLEKLCYRKLSDVALSGFVTHEQLRPREALKRPFKPMPVGTPWGAKWEYAWFRAAVTLPKEAKGEWIVFRCGAGTGFTGDPGGEGRFIVNGREMGGRDWAHPQVILSTNARPGARFDILMEAYAGHGPMNCGGGPVPHGELTVPEPPAAQQTVKPCSLGIWDEEVFQAWLDVQTLLELRDKLDPDSLRVSEIDEGLRQFTLIADLELPRAEMLATIRAARKRLKPLLECTNGSTAPLLYCYGHSHIDVAWLWPLAETERKCARTFATQLTLMEMYPEYKFLQSQPHLFRMTQRLYPDVYARIKAAAKRGQWLSEGGMWVEADTNVSGGEALIRQFLHGKRFYRDEFGVDCELMWLPDVFGYSGAMPQIMAGCGIKYFSTQKIFWNYNGGDPFPYNTFWWEGIDGTRVLSHFHNDYNSQTNPATLIQRWKERVQKDGLNARIVPFGWGDGGGGPTRLHLEFLRRQRDLEGAPRTVIASPLDFFHAEEARRSDWPVYVGELYYQCHRGTYTTQARTKRGNRKCEFALREAELWGAAAAAAGKLRYPAAKMDEAWKGVLLNQFHDIIPGSSIHRVYEEAEALHAQVLATATSVAASAAKALAAAPHSALRTPHSIAVFNSLSWDRLALVPLPKGFKGAESNGQGLLTQRIGGTLYAEALLPSCGWTTLAVGGASLPRVPRRGDTPPTVVKATERGMENDLIRLRLNDRGEIVSLVDKATGRELAAAPMNAFRLFKDVPRWFDAWDIDSTYELAPVELPEKAAIEVVATGPLAAVLRITRKISDSAVTQEVWLRRGSRRVEFRTKIDWRERHKLLKVAFPTTLHANEAIHEVQFGHLRRPTHRSRPYDADRFEVANQKWTALAEEDRGAAVLNDCKYGVNALGGSINLTLLRSPLAPDMTADQGLQEVTYALTAWNGSFFASDLVREAYEVNVAPLVVPGGAGEGSLFQLDAPNVVIETVKPAEDGSGDLIVRLYEAKHSATRCVLRTSLPVTQALSTNLLEEGGEPLPLKAGAIALDLRPFEIKTVRLRPA